MSDAGSAFFSHNIDVTGDAVIDGTALVTGVLTTTAATVFTGGFSTKAVGTIQHTDGVANVSLTPTATGGVVNVRDDGGNSVISLDGRDSSAIVKLVSINADASVGPVLDLYRNSGSPAVNDRDRVNTFYW